MDDTKSRKSTPTWETTTTEDRPHTGSRIEPRLRIAAVGVLLASTLALGAGAFGRPLDVSAAFTSAPWSPNGSYAGFNDTWDYSNGARDEYGIDVPLPGGTNGSTATPIRAPESGTIIGYQAATTCGNWQPGRLLVKLTSGPVVGFGHVNNFHFAPNTVVSAGQEIATVGNQSLWGCGQQDHVEFMFDQSGQGAPSYYNRSYFLPGGPIPQGGAIPGTGCPRNGWAGGGSGVDPCTVLISYMRGVGPLSTGLVQFLVATSGGSAYHSIRSSNGNWTAFNQVSWAPPQVTAVAASGDGNPGETQFLVATSGGAVYHSIRFSNGNWTAFNQVSWAPPQVTAVAATGDGNPGEAQFLVATTNGGLYHTIRYSNGSWQSAFGTPPGVPGSITAVAATGDGNRGEAQFMVATSNGGALYHTIRFGNGSWQSSFGKVPSQPSAISAVAGAADGYQGEAQFLVATSGGALYHTIRFSNGAWQSFGHPSMPGVVMSVAAAGDGTLGEVQFLVANQNGALFHSIRFSTGSWQAFTQLSGVPGPIAKVTAAGI